MHTCVIFNPAARGNKARHFHRHLDAIGGQSALKATAAPGDARRLATHAIADGFDLIVAAGGDGTLNEVLNGIGDAPDGFERARMGVLPLGTVNVFARELNIPLQLERAWEIVRCGREIKIDLGRAEFLAGGVPKNNSSRSLRARGWTRGRLTRGLFGEEKIGPLAYVVAGLKALRERKPAISVKVDGQNVSGELVLIGNGKFYGGSFGIFPAADLRDGILHICIFPRVDFPALFRCIPDFLARRKLPEKIVLRFQAERFELVCDFRRRLNWTASGREICPRHFPWSAKSCASFVENGGLGETRTLDQCLKRALLYRLSYQPAKDNHPNSCAVSRKIFHDGKQEAGRFAGRDAEAFVVHRLHEFADAAEHPGLHRKMHL